MAVYALLLNQHSLVLWLIRLIWKMEGNLSEILSSFLCFIQFCEANLYSYQLKVTTSQSWQHSGGHCEIVFQFLHWFRYECVHLFCPIARSRVSQQIFSSHLIPVYHTDHVPPYNWFLSQSIFNCTLSSLLFQLKEASLS